MEFCECWNPIGYKSEQEITILPDYHIIPPVLDVTLYQQSENIVVLHCFHLKVNFDNFEFQVQYSHKMKLDDGCH